jgi:Cupin domain
MGATEEHSSIPSTAVEFAPGLWRTSLQRHDLSVPGREMIQSRVDIGPDSPPIRHTHPGEEIIYVLAGSLDYQVDGQPTKIYNEGARPPHPSGRPALSQPQIRTDQGDPHACHDRKPGGRHSNPAIHDPEGPFGRTPGAAGAHRGHPLARSGDRHR